MIEAYIGKGVQWRSSGERLTCTGDAEHRHRPKLLRVVQVETLDPLPDGQPQNAALLLQCPECGQMRYAFANDVVPCGEPAPERFPARAEPPLHVLQQALVDGKTIDAPTPDRQHWKHYPPGRLYVYQHPKHAGYIQAPYGDEDPAFMQTLIRSTDADSVLVVWCVLANLLAQDEGRDDIPAGMTPTVIVDIYDTARRVGLIRNKSKSRKDTLHGMRKVWDALRALERYRVYSEGKGIDPETRKEIRTVLESPLIMFGSTERAIQPSLWKEASTPKAQEISLTTQWYWYLKDARYAIYIEGGEALAKLPARQPAGAWARAIGMLLLQQFRLNGGKPVVLSRRYLLFRLPAAVKPAEELLADVDHKGRAQEYWDRAMRHLVRVQILAHPPQDDAPANGDWDAWLERKLTFVPGALPLRALRGLPADSQDGKER